MAKAKKTARYLGYCPVCMREIKVRKRLLVHHGFERPGDGMGIIGDCFGALRVPHELSPETAEEWLAQVLTLQAGAEKRLARLPQATHLQQWDYQRGGHVPVAKVDLPAWQWEELYRGAEYRLQQEISNLGREIERVRELVATWEPRTLTSVQEAVAHKRAAQEAQARKKQLQREAKAEKKVAYYQKQAAAIDKKLPKVLAQYEKDPRGENEYTLRKLERRIVDLYFDAPDKLGEIFGYGAYAISDEDARAMLGLDDFFARYGVGPHTKRADRLFPRIGNR